MSGEQFSQMMQDPRMRQMIQQRAGQQGQGGGMQQGMKRPANSLSNLADAYPKMKEQMDKLKIEEAERKAKKLKFEMILKKAEQAFQLKQQQQAIQAGRESI